MVHSFRIHDGVDAIDPYAGGNFQQELKGRRDLLTVEARYSPRLYARQIRADGERTARKDRRRVFEVDYERPLTRDVRLGVDYRYETRGSNDPDKVFDGHVFGVTSGFDWCEL